LRPNPGHLLLMMPAPVLDTTMLFSARLAALLRIRPEPPLPMMVLLSTVKIAYSLLLTPFELFPSRMLRSSVTWMSQVGGSKHQAHTALALAVIRFWRKVTLPHARRMNAVLRHRKWQASLDKDRFFDQVFGQASRS
jgi:hypothetical protein